MAGQNILTNIQQMSAYALEGVVANAGLGFLSSNVIFWKY